MAIDSQTLAELKERLLAEKKRMEEECGQFAKTTDVEDNYQTKFDDLGENLEDSATEVEEYADNLALESSLEKQLKEIDGALVDMDQGIYGICKNCNQEIDIARLKAYPAARTCIKCK
jgi:DnaK suppressor protein